MSPAKGESATAGSRSCSSKLNSRLGLGVLGRVLLVVCTAWQMGCTGSDDDALADKVLGDEDADTLTAMGNLAITLWAQGKWDEARAIEERVLDLRRRVLGDEHPSTLIVMGNLALTLWDQGELAEAKALLEQVLEVRRQASDVRHPDTLWVMGSLIVLHRDLKEESAVESLVMELADAVSRVELPANHQARRALRLVGLEPQVDA